jgi:short-subunit dehydrogenase
MSASESYSHIVNTASVGGLLSWHSMSSYGAAKAAVVAFTEALHYEYQKQSNLGFSVLCPGTVQSNIFQESLEHGDAGEHGKEMAELMDGQLKAYGMSPQELAKITFDAIEERRYWIFTHPEFKPEYKRRVDVLLSEQIPDADLCLYGA